MCWHMVLTFEGMEGVVSPFPHFVLPCRHLGVIWSRNVDSGTVEVLAKRLQIMSRPLTQNILDQYCALVLCSSRLNGAECKFMLFADEDGVGNTVLEYSMNVDDEANGFAVALMCLRCKEDVTKNELDVFRWGDRKVFFVLPEEMCNTLLRT